MIIKTFGWSFAVTIIALAGALFLGGPTALALVAILCVLEISLSFDNAVVNATILEKMNAFWQKMFLTVGILIAVFGMRLLFPLLIVGVTAGLNPVEAVNLAREGGPIDQPGTYAYLLHEAHPSIAAFGGMFLMMLFLDFIFEDRDIQWLHWLERPLAKIGKLDQLSVVIALVALVLAAELLAKDAGEVMVAGGLGIVTYLLVNGLGELFENAGEDASEEDGAERSGPNQLVKASGKAAFFLFMYLEVLDASFSFDGVIGAFAITQDIFIIAVGLGVGAMYIRSMTVYLIRKGTLKSYVYLEHGAFWAIGALATILLISIKTEVPEVVTGLIGVGFIAAALVSSILRNRRHPELVEEIHAGHHEETDATPAETDAAVGARQQ
ncbi:DUF475 domain-containing protein [Terracoccus luteus]|uniref:YkoY family integral membrane protein n=1 Tax=Terracoccus luteus TaxID=53356 RepID=A0A839PZ79_9MICO|nr:DUF475 domain-containing protein [Terracoccus luteus]MBB2988453.1 hypothetical protein [Terracoccus luteus]MCP2174092.1 hypothetical protein [Terracoccus luteus]